MDYFHTDDPETIQWLCDAFTTAAMTGRKVRILTEGQILKVKIGEGCWTAPISSTPDAYRDKSTVVDDGNNMIMHIVR